MKKSLFFGLLLSGVIFLFFQEFAMGETPDEKKDRCKKTRDDAYTAAGSDRAKKDAAEADYITCMGGPSKDICTAKANELSIASKDFAYKCANAGFGGVESCIDRVSDCVDSIDDIELTSGSESCGGLTSSDYNSQLKDLNSQIKDAKKDVKELEKDTLTKKKEFAEKKQELDKDVRDLSKENQKAVDQAQEADDKILQEQFQTTAAMEKQMTELQVQILDLQLKKEQEIENRANTLLELTAPLIESQCKNQVREHKKKNLSTIKANNMGLSDYSQKNSSNNFELQALYDQCISLRLAQRATTISSANRGLQRIDQQITMKTAELNKLNEGLILAKQMTQKAQQRSATKKQQGLENYYQDQFAVQQKMYDMNKDFTEFTNLNNTHISQAQTEVTVASNELALFKEKKPPGDRKGSGQEAIAGFEAIKLICNQYKAECTNDKNYGEYCISKPPAKASEGGTGVR